MTDRAYVEIEPSDLFLAHFYGPVGGPVIPETHEITKITTPLKFSIQDHDAASGSAYVERITLNGEVCFRFMITDGVDVHMVTVPLSGMWLPNPTIAAI